MSRRPTDGAAAWAEWRARLDGAEVRLDVSAPRCGFYRAKRFGRWWGVKIDLVQDIDADSGELVADERIAAWWHDGKEDDPDRLWSYCASSPITADAFARLRAMPAVTDLSKQVIV